jgi:RNA polymerase sigma-70 factor (ECF subfamily)
LKLANLSAPQNKKTENACAQRDDILVAAARSGSSHAFAELRRLYSPRIYRTIYSITKNREDAEDALQDTFLRAYMGLSAFEGRANFSSWITRIAINSSLMLLRKRSKRLEISLSTASNADDDLPLFEFKDLAPNPEQSYDQDQRRQKLLRAIRKLAPPLRAVVEARMTGDCTVREAARILKISEAAAKSRLYRARTRLTTLRGFTTLTHRHFAETGLTSN